MICPWVPGPNSDTQDKKKKAGTASIKHSLGEEILSRWFRSLQLVPNSTEGANSPSIFTRQNSLDVEMKVALAI
jgi:hypothetical protein